MYHFTAEQPAAPLVLSHRSQVPGRICQYLKDFQLEAVRFLSAQLTKHKFCVLNDESGLGKTATIAVLLGAIAANKKCLLIVQNDDQLIKLWQFHLNVLTNLTVTVIRGRYDTTDSAHNVYVVKWGTLRNIVDLSKFKFDIVVCDNRGQMLNNSFCTSMLIRNYEKKLNVIISSVDITSDIKLLHNILRLGGRLEHQYENYKAFEDKFKLPDTKDITSKKVELEEYFLKREMLTNYCKEFRLRRYRHQYESVMPLVESDCFKKHFEKWLESNQEHNEVTHNRNGYFNGVNALGFETDTEELFVEFVRRERSLNREVFDVTAGVRPNQSKSNSEEFSEEPVIMSPLLVVTDSEDDNVDAPVEQLDPYDFVDLTADEEQMTNKIVMRNVECPNKVRSQKQVEKVVNNKNTEKTNNLNNAAQQNHTQVEIVASTEGTNKGANKNEQVQAINKQKTIVIQSEMISSTQVPYSKLSCRQIEEILSQNDTVSSVRTISNSEKNTNIRSSKKQNIVTTEKNVEKEPTVTRRQLRSTSKIEEKKLQDKKTHKKDKKPKTASAIMNQLKILEKAHGMSTRSAECTTRATRSAANKYILDVDSLDLLKKSRRKKRERIVKSKTNEMQVIDENSKENTELPTKHKKQKVNEIVGTKQSEKIIKVLTTKDQTTRSQVSIIPSSDYDEIECAQKLTCSSNSEHNSRAHDGEFLIPPTPPMSRAIAAVPLLPFNSCSSELALLANTEPEVITLSGSYSESSNIPSSQSRRTRALKPNKVQQQQMQQQQIKTKVAAISKVSAIKTRTFEERVGNNWPGSKSPDLFSNCSDMPISCTQAQHANQCDKSVPFEAFKVYDAAVKSLQQKHAATSAAAAAAVGKKRRSSCLFILERMFDERNNKPHSTQMPMQTQTAKSKNAKKKKSPILPTLPRTSHKQSTGDRRAKKTNNNSSIQFAEISQHSESVSPQHEPQARTSHLTQNNKITNYLLGATQTINVDAAEAELYQTPNRIISVHKTQKSPKSPKSPRGIAGSTQTTKLTRWLLKRANSSIGNTKQPFQRRRYQNRISSCSDTSDSEIEPRVPQLRSRMRRYERGLTKRKRLELN